MVLVQGAVLGGIAELEETMALDVVETPGTSLEAVELCDAPVPQTVSVTVTTSTSR